MDKKDHERTGVVMNTDTNLLKLIAAFSMLLDHTGAVFFPDHAAFHIVGRLAFPLFCYCTFVGAMHTHDVRKYLLRLGACAVFSQLPYVLAFQATPAAMAENWYYPNVIFTLFAAVVLVLGLRRRTWWLIALTAAVMLLAPLDYGYDALILMLLFYLLRDKPLPACLLTTAYLASAFFTASDGTILGLSFGVQGCAAFSVPLIFHETGLHPRVNKYFFYVFYPAHLFLLYFIALMVR